MHFRMRSLFSLANSLSLARLPFQRFLDSQEADLVHELYLRGTLHALLIAMAALVHLPTCRPARLL